MLPTYILAATIHAPSNDSHAAAVCAYVRGFPIAAHGLLGPTLESPQRRLTFMLGTFRRDTTALRRYLNACLPRASKSGKGAMAAREQRIRLSTSDLQMSDKHCRYSLRSDNPYNK